jgi:hypothetical protein
VPFLHREPMQIAYGDHGPRHAGPGERPMPPPLGILVVAHALGEPAGVVADHGRRDGVQLGHAGGGQLTGIAVEITSVRRDRVARQAAFDQKMIKVARDQFLDRHRRPSGGDIRPAAPPAGGG